MTLTCKTSNENSDPLLDELLKYGINLLALPRTGFQVGQIGIQQPARKKNGIVPNLREMPIDTALILTEEQKAITLREETPKRLANLTIKKSKAIEASVGLGFLDSFLPSFSASLDASIESVRAIHLRLLDATLRELRPGDVDDKLRGAKLDPKCLYAVPGSRYFLSVGCVESNNLKIDVLGKDDARIGLKATASDIGNAGGKFRMSVAGDASICVSPDDDSTQYCFGARLMELVFEDDGTLRLVGVDEHIRMFGKEDLAWEPESLSFVGAGSGDSVFVEF